MRGDAGFPVRDRASPSGARCGSSRTATSPARSSARSASSSCRSRSPQGFSPRPKVSFGLALSVGHESDAEYLDVELTEPVDTDALAERLTAALPEGIDVTGAVRAGRPRARPAGSRSPQSSTGSSRRRPTAGPSPDAVLDAAASTARWRATELLVTRTRKGKESVDDIRPAIRSHRGSAHDGDARRCSSSPCRRNPAVPDRVRCSTPSTRSSASASPSTASLRTSQWIERGGARLEPLEADAFAPVLEASAS